ncbi:MAG: hypothetical protein QOF32_340 [Gammaproteobacteria bacterium]|jgi:hypothetical protein|nr:hypothetical protein [Gammaproteobacteria bacterium]
MNTTNGETGSENSEIASRQVGETMQPHTHGQYSSMVGESPPPKRGRKVTVKANGGELIERQFQRRNNINILPGLIREHARLIQLIRNGEIPLDRGEVLSRAYGRHKEMVTALEQRTQLEAIRQQLAELRASPGIPIPKADVQLADSHSEEDTK